MAIAQRYVAQQQTGRGGPSGLADVLEVLLDKGLVIDAFVRVSLVGIELLTVDARVVVASVDTYLRFAEAVNRLDLLQASNSRTLGDLVGGSSGGRDRRERRDEDGREDGGRNGSRRHELVGGRSERGSERASGEAAGEGEASGEEDQQPAQRGPEQAARRGDQEEDQESSEGGLLSRIKQRGQAF